MGLNFTPNTTLLLNGVPVGTVTFVDSSHLTVVVGPLAAGVYDISLTNYGPSNVLVKALTVNATGTSDEAPPGMATAAVGEFRQSVVDLAIPAGIGPSFVLARTYRSRFGPANSPMGKGWDFSGNISVETSGDDVIIHDGDGRADKFFRQTNGTVAERYEYADYGEPEFFDGAGVTLSGSAVGNVYLFGVMRFDTESGFYSSPSLDPRIGSTLQRDPKWQCKDDCIEKGNDMVSGMTDHL